MINILENRVIAAVNITILDYRINKYVSLKSFYI